MHRSPCPSVDTLDLFLGDTLDTDERCRILDHVESCPTCQKRMEDLLAAGSLTSWPLTARAAPEDGPDPEYLKNLRSLVTQTAFSSWILDSSQKQLAPPTLNRPEASADCPASIGSYEVLGEIARGGMAVVYKARQPHLGRIVAVKRLRYYDRDPADIQRFLREAEAIADLRHPNIVQVFQVGEDDGRPFLALEYVQGPTLAEYLNGAPIDPRLAAEFIRKVAAAVHHAHDRGVIHRDLKPANILLDPTSGSPPHHSKEGMARPDRPRLDSFEPRVTDFGLARRVGDDRSLTLPDMLAGTPAYLAPEQLKSKKDTITPACDIYALGAILYEMLTGRPPLLGPNVFATLRLVETAEPVPPSRLQPRLPRDLETVCQKCLEKDPARRYPTAQQLVEDLARFGDGRPVHARPIRWPSRTWRWCHRHPARATTILLALSVLVILAIGGPIVARREYSLRHQADVEKDRARQHLELASRALDETVGGLVEDARLRTYRMDDVRAEALRGAVPYLEDFASRDEGSPEIQVRQARATIQLATVNAGHGRPELAASQFRRGIALLERLANSTESDQHQADLAGAHMEYGRFLLTGGAATVNQSAAAERELRTALQISDGLGPDDQGPSSQRDQKAIILSLLATVPSNTKAQLMHQRDLLARAVRIRERLVAENPDRPDLQRYATMAAFNLGLTLRQLGQNQEAADTLTKALEEERRLSGSIVASADGPRARSDIEGTLGETLFDLDRRAEGLEHVDEARRITEAAAMLFPGEVDYLDKALRWSDVMAGMLDTMKKSDRALEIRNEAVALAVHVNDGAPAGGVHRDGLLAARLTLAEQLARAGRREADAEFAAAAAVGRELPSAPSDSERAASRAECFRRLAIHDLDGGRANEALAWLDRAVTLIDHDARWSDGPFRRDVETCRAKALDRLNCPKEAAAARTRADRCHGPTNK
jgi:serine/threonine protein kinase/tetratricopeptide (TPR) repeat protein